MHVAKDPQSASVRVMAYNTVGVRLSSQVGEEISLLQARVNTLIDGVPERNEERAELVDILHLLEAMGTTAGVIIRGLHRAIALAEIARQAETASD